MFYGHTAILPSDIQSGANLPEDVAILNPVNVQAHLSVLSYLVEDIGCRYQLACSKLRRLLEPLLKPEISPLGTINFMLFVLMCKFTFYFKIMFNVFDRPHIVLPAQRERKEQIGIKQYCRSSDSLLISGIKDFK